MMPRTCCEIAALLVLAIALTGCASVKPEPGKSAVVIDLRAEPRWRPSSADGGEYSTASGSSDASQAAGPQWELLNYDALPGIVVSLAPVGATIEPPSQPVAIRLPTASDAVYAVSVGQWVEFNNASGKAMTIFSVSDGNAFELKLPANGGAGYRVKTAGTIEVLSEASPETVAWIRAVAAPYVSVGQAGKAVTFNNIAPGNYTAAAWHWRLPGSSAAVAAMPDKVTRVTLRVGVSQLKAQGR